MVDVATQLLSHPFRLLPNGVVATLPDGDDNYYAEQLAILIMTQPGERELVPAFGLRDPAYEGIDLATLSAQITLFGPPVSLEDVQVKPANDTEVDVAIAFQSRSSGM